MIEYNISKRTHTYAKLARAVTSHSRCWREHRRSVRFGIGANISHMYVSGATHIHIYIYLIVPPKPDLANPLSAGVDKGDRGGGAEVSTFRDSMG